MLSIENPMDLELPKSLFGGGLVMPFQDLKPSIGEDVFLAPRASIIGQVTLGDKVSIWFGAVLRGDIARIEVGEGSNIQDNSALHVGNDDPCLVGRNVVVGHKVTLHGCTVEDNCLIEVQGTAEGAPFTRETLDRMLDLAARGIAYLVECQREALV